MAEARIFGYAEPMCARAGGRVEFMISAEGAEEVEARLVRLIHGDEHPDGPGFVEEEVESAVPARLRAARQYTQLGAYAEAADPEGRLDAPGAFTAWVHVFPTLNRNERQAVMGRWSVNDNLGWALGLDPEGRPSLWVGDGAGVDEIRAPTPAVPRCWIFLAARFDPTTKQAELHVIDCVNPWNSRTSTVVPFELSSWTTETLRRNPAKTGGAARFVFAGASERNPERGEFVSLLFNGKIDRAGVAPRLLDRAEIEALARGAAPSGEVIARWDPTVGIERGGVGDLIRDVGPHGLHAAGVNRPVRLMTGYNWRGADSFHLAPETFGGVHYHDDALTDCRWKPTISLDLPEGLRSGVYALRLRAGRAEDHVTFFVRPDRPKGRIAVQMSTFTYLAYANDHLAYEAPVGQAIVAHTAVISPVDLEFKKLDEFGLSTYDHHADGAGVCYSSWRRPIVGIRPKYRLPSMNFPWTLPADLSLIWWLEHAGYDYDVITDHDVDREGVACLKPYMAVLNVTHPEYYSEAMLDATEDYLREGGRLLYIGGNGYYWVTETRPDEPHCIEVRKLDSGSRAWQAEPGEGHLAATGAKSGLWRNRGRPPQKITGLGFSTEGFDESQPFERMPDSFHRRVAWIFDGIGDEEKIGDFGLGAGGAAGIELDRYELALGTPPHALLIAASWGHSDNYPLVSEEVTYAFPGRGGTQDYQVRGDMVFFPTPKHGAVFAAGSIAWSQALPCRGGDNNVARIMKNVLDAFTKPGPLPGADMTGDEKLWR